MKTDARAGRDVGVEAADKQGFSLPFGKAGKERGLFPALSFPQLIYPFSTTSPYSFCILRSENKTRKEIAMAVQGLFLDLKPKTPATARRFRMLWTDRIRHAV